MRSQELFYQPLFERNDGNSRDRKMNGHEEPIWQEDW
jgi:hypothetical protein